MKPTQVKVWPDQVSYIPLLHSASDATHQTSRLNIDFSGCHEFDSCGLAATCLRILQHVGKSVANMESINWETNPQDAVPPLASIARLGFFLPLREYHRRTLFSDEDALIFPDELEPFAFTKNSILKKSYPLMHIAMSKERYDRRAPLKKFKKVLLENLLPLEEKYNINTRQLIYILFELAKNTADHTEADAIVGVDIETSAELVKISFIYGDLGEGIKDNITKNLPEEFESRGPHMSLYEAYYRALQRGFTTKLNSKKNLGIGLPTAIDCAKGMGVNLSVFDASSRGVLSGLETTSHKELRKNFYSCSRNVPFCYFATLEAPIR